MKPLKIEEIRVNRLVDAHPDPSYLDEHDERAKSYSRGEWGFMGIQAEATVSYECGPQGECRLETLTSGGLWGIEDDAGEEYLNEIAEEQIADLIAHLEHFGIAIAPEQVREYLA